MSQQTELECVSCDTAFDPGPTGGFCPECDTPHPEFDHQTPDESEGETADATADDAPADDPAAAASEPAASTGDPAGGAAAAQAGPSYCPDCGTSLSDVTERPGAADAWDCPDCGRTVTDESFCPDCGTDLEAARAGADAGEGAADTAAARAEGTSPAEGTAEDEDVEEAETEITGDAEAAAAGTPGTVTLVVNGEPYAFRDGDTFGREDEAWLEDLVKAAGGSDALSYISGEHVEFSIEDDGVYVTDVSRNGTMLNGRDLDGGRAEVEDGDYLTLSGRAEVQVRL